MTKAFALSGTLAVALAGSTGAFSSSSHSDRAGAQVRQIRGLSFELVGQLQNSAPGVTPPTHIHYGYLSYIRGLSVFRGTAQNETTALFTFYAKAATPRVISNGPLRIITRVGKLTIYRDPSTNADFARPASFRDGRPVLIARLRQQVVSNTVTGSFTTFHENAIVSTRPFSADGRRVQLGRVGETFRAFFSGQVTMPGPPSGVFGGYAVSG
jgi:hypothetical protein